MKELTIRPCQEPMFDTITRLDRCNVFASPGTGKTSGTLMALDVLSIVDDKVFPVLVVAPKRVANTVWHREVATWGRFKGVRVSRVLGTKAQREAALKVSADIYVINPSNLKWLHETVGDNWPFKTVVADESTFLKNHRTRFQTTPTGKTAMYVDRKNASALVRHAPKTTRWINLTGTPTPNGVKDLWGQHWPIDFGEALGANFSVFKERWFKPVWGSSKEQERIVPLAGAADRIVELIKPRSVLVDAYDYFDIERPIEIDIPIELPPAARKVYADIHKDSVAELIEGSVKAVNIGAKVIKCRQIASGHVLDDEGVARTLHTEKLAALEELRDKLAGAPLLVAYWFKEDLAAIQRKFKDAVLLPKEARQQEKVEDAWNRGEIPMLLVSPASAGHGLSLQHGGHHLCMYTMDWNAEYYEQVIERIGPTRQAQSGYKRLVYVHRLIATKTWEEVVAARLKDKFDVTTAVKMALAM